MKCFGALDVAAIDACKWFMHAVMRRMHIIPNPITKQHQIRVGRPSSSRTLAARRYTFFVHMWSMINRPRYVFDLTLTTASAPCAVL